MARMRKRDRRRDLPSSEAHCHRRRHFLRGAAGLLGALSVTKAFAAPVSPRSLSLVHTHTGETLTATYFDGSAYVPDALTQMNGLLRDFRTGDVMPMDAALFDILWDLQVATNREAIFEIICGYRSPATNTMLHSRSSGVAEHSQHLLGKAIDLRLSGFSTQRLAEYARSLGRGGVGFYAKSDFVHVDTGRVRFW